MDRFNSYVLHHQLTHSAGQWGRKCAWKSSEPGSVGWSRVSAEQWPVEGIRPLYQRRFGTISFKPAASKGCVVGCSNPVAVFIQSRMSQTFSWCDLCQSFIHNLQQLYRSPHVHIYAQEVRNLYLKQICKTSWFPRVIFQNIIHFYRHSHTAFSFQNNSILNF